MAVAVWVLGNTEAEIRAWLDKYGMVPESRLIAAGYRARWMLRAGQAEADPAPEDEHD
jgi:hypothetical protein